MFLEDCVLVIVIVSFIVIVQHRFVIVVYLLYTKEIKFPTEYIGGIGTVALELTPTINTKTLLLYNISVNKYFFLQNNIDNHFKEHLQIVIYPACNTRVCTKALLPIK